MEVIWWTFFQIFVFIFGGGGGVLGKRMLNSEVLKYHEDLITLATYMYNKEKQWILSFTYVENINIFEYIGAPSWLKYKIRKE